MHVGDEGQIGRVVVEVASELSWIPGDHTSIVEESDAVVAAVRDGDEASLRPELRRIIAPLELVPSRQRSRR